MKSLGVVLAVLICSLQGLFGIINIEEPVSPLPRRPLKFSIHDMGATDLPPSSMSPFAMPHSLAPRINNEGVVSGNRADEGFFRSLNQGEMVPQMGYCLRTHAYGLNNAGEIISTLERNKENVDWFIWTQKNLRKEKRFPIEPGDAINGLNIDLRAINDNKWAVGYINPGCVLRPAVWNPEHGLKPLGFYLGWDFKGVALGINQKTSIVGLTTEYHEEFPFIWNKHCGLEILRHFRTRLEAQAHIDILGPINFADVVVTEDNYVYGTLWINEAYYGIDPLSVYYAYRWEPYSKDFRLLCLDGMRINAVNVAHTLVGKIDEQAVLRFQGRKPEPLKNYLNNSEWELIEATDINDKGDIVGYGKYKGELHIFLMKRE